MPDQPPTSDLISYRIAVRTGTVAAVFSLLVAALLLYDFFHRPMKDPFTMKDPSRTSARDVLKAALKGQPASESIKEEVRRLDQETRDEYFRQQAFTLSGGVLLCGGILVSLVAAKWAATLRRRHPQLLPGAGQRDWEASWTPAARWTVAGLFVVLAATAAVLSVPLHATVAENPDGQVAAVADAPSPAGQGAGAAVESPSPHQPSVGAGTGVGGAGGHIASIAPGRVPIGAPAAAAKASSAAPAKVAGISAEELARAWPCFRGRGGSGISPYANVPDDWDGRSGKNIVWKSPIPLAGVSSPVVVAGRIICTGADENRRQVFCYEAKSGKLLWQRDVPSTPDSRKPVKLNEDTGYAACTAATDGRYLAAIFANGDMAAYDLDGNLAWSQSLGIPDNPYGHAASLSIYKDLLLVPIDQATAKDARSKLRALDIATGRTVWEQTRAVPSSWSTPIVVRAGGRDQVVTTASPWVIAYDPAGGKELWRVKGSQCDVAPSPVSAGNVVIAAGNDITPVLAIRADGSGDVTASHVLWKGEDNTPDICSPLATEEFVFLLTSDGMLTCYDAQKGDKLWEEDLAATPSNSPSSAADRPVNEKPRAEKPGVTSPKLPSSAPRDKGEKPREEELNNFRCKSSPSLVGKQLYVFAEAGRCWILSPTRAGVKRVRQTDLGEGCVTCPAFQDGRMYVRGKKNLICIGKL